SALVAAGLARGIRDTIVNLNERHLLQSAETVYEALEDAGLTTAAINITTYRGRQQHVSSVPGLPPVHGPKHFFFYSVYESDRTGAPVAWRNRAGGSIDAYAGQVILAAARGWEFADLAGRSHLGGGSHGSLAADDSEVPMLTIGFDEPPASITGLKSLFLRHFGVHVARAA